MPTYLYKIQVVRPAMLSDGPTAEESDVTSQHFEYLKDLEQKGIVILAGRTQNDDYSSFGIVIFNAESDDAAQAIVDNDPVVKKRIMRAELYPYSIAIFNPDSAAG
jgi:uncharacterized protein YciI